MGILLIIYIINGYDIETSILAAIYSMLSSTFYFLIIPFICYAYNSGRLEYEKGKKICKKNSIIMCIILNTISIINSAISSGYYNFEANLLLKVLMAIDFYYINMNFFVKYNKEEKMNEKVL